MLRCVSHHVFLISHSHESSLILAPANQLNGTLRPRGEIKKDRQRKKDGTLPVLEEEKVRQVCQTLVPTDFPVLMTQRLWLWEQTHSENFETGMMLVYLIAIRIGSLGSARHGSCERHELYIIRCSRCEDRRQVWTVIDFNLSGARKKIGTNSPAVYQTGN